jgi:hypothetical protein
LNLKDFGVRANAKWHRWHDQTHIPHLESTPCIEGIPESEESSLPSARMTLPAGTYEWPFEFIIPGSMVESVEGLADAHIKYKLQATVIQATVIRGRLSHDFHAFKPVRIIRTLDPSALAHAMSAKNLWPNKVEYSIVVSQWAIAFGTSIQIEMTFMPLLKGLKIGTIKCDLVELHDWTLKFPIFGYQHWKKSRDIASWKFVVDEKEHYQDVIDNFGRGGWVLKETLLLPKSLKDCIQDVETLGIKIHHMVKFNITLENPDWHISEVRKFSIKFSLHLLISSDTPKSSSHYLYLSKYANG